MDMRDLHALGTREELPQRYLDELAAANLVPLWPSLREALPPGAPRTKTIPTVWPWALVRPLLLQAGKLTPMEKAERRVLVLANPGRAPELQASAAMFLGMQLVLPGEVAPNHRHTPNAVRIVVEGRGGCTVVEGESCPMEHGDLILTPTGLWHEHRHQGEGPLVWLDVLDLPLVLALERSYVVGGAAQRTCMEPQPARAAYPTLRYPWTRTRDMLLAMAEAWGPGAVQLRYADPRSGGDVLNTLAFAAYLVRPLDTGRLERICAARVFHVVDGEGEIEVDGEAYNVERGDTCCVPGLASVRLGNLSGERPLFLIGADESPIHRKLGLDVALAP